MLTPEVVNEYAKAIYEQNVERGWWDDPDRCIYQTFQLVNTEVAEATEGDRKDLMDDHLPHRKMAEVEMADVMIRLLDLAGRYGWRYQYGYSYHWRLDGMQNPAARHLVLTAQVCGFALAVDALDGDTPLYCATVETILEVCRIEGYDLGGAMDEKLAYNKTRADHDRANRSACKGKRY